MIESPKLYRLSLTRLALTCLYIGVTGYGGPAIVGHMKQIFVDKKKWITEDEFITGLSLSQLLPSAIGVNTIQFIGYQLRGSLGAIVAPLCFIAPAIILMTVLSALYFAFGRLGTMQSLFVGLGAVVVALIINAAVSLGKSAIKDVWGGIAAMIGFVIVHWSVGGSRSIVLIALVSALLGFVAYRGKVADNSSARTDTQCTQNSRTFWLTFTTVIVGISGILFVTRHSPMTELVAAILRVGAFTFGGGFMSIPIFQHESVVAHHWLTNDQFLAGLALGQITPGPVLITANFIGYKVGGVLGALLGSIAVFTPGSIGMFILAHQHERVKHLVWLQAVIRGIVAGFMGVLFSVIIRLAMHSLFSWHSLGMILKTTGMTVLSLIVLLVLKKDPLWVIVGGAVVSLILFR